MAVAAAAAEGSLLDLQPEPRRMLDNWAGRIEHHIHRKPVRSWSAGELRHSPDRNQVDPQVGRSWGIRVGHLADYN